MHTQEKFVSGLLINETQKILTHGEDKILIMLKNPLPTNTI